MGPRILWRKGPAPHVPAQNWLNLQPRISVLIYSLQQYTSVYTQVFPALYLLQVSSHEIVRVHLVLPACCIPHNFHSPGCNHSDHIWRGAQGMVFLFVQFFSSFQTTPLWHKSPQRHVLRSSLLTCKSKFQANRKL